MKIPFDSDFDESSSSAKEDVGLNILTGRLAFIVGLITAVLVMSTFGFLILLIFILRS